MSQHIDHLKVGDQLDFKGPLMKISVEELSKRKRLGLIAGGSGLTPMLQASWGRRPQPSHHGQDVWAGWGGRHARIE